MASTLTAFCDPFAVTRLNDGQPIISESMFVALGASAYEGENINGPSVLRVPDWVARPDRADPAANYYLYFAHHKGDYMRMAWAEAVEGPWHLYHVGKGVAVGARGVLDLGEGDALVLDNDLKVFEHIASPDVHLDEANHRFVMYFHGPTKHKGKTMGQMTFAATSSQGLDFRENVVPVMLGRSYFRVFAHGAQLYAFSNNGELYRAPAARAPDAEEPSTPPKSYDFSKALWIKRPDNAFQTHLQQAGIKERLRHSTVHLIGETLHVFYTRLGGSPERIMHSTIDLSVGDYTQWNPTFPAREILHAELEWEGGDIEPSPSTWDKAPENVNQLRDPYFFEEADGTLYLFYAGRGEDAIGIAGISLGGSDS